MIIRIKIIQGLYSRLLVFTLLSLISVNTYAGDFYYGGLNWLGVLPGDKNSGNAMISTLKLNIGRRILPHVSLEAAFVAPNSGVDFEYKGASKSYQNDSANIRSKRKINLDRFLELDAVVSSKNLGAGVVYAKLGLAQVAYSGTYTKTNAADYYYENATTTNYSQSDLELTYCLGLTLGRSYVSAFTLDFGGQTKISGSDNEEVSEAVTINIGFNMSLF